ncbi:beta-mannosidase, putative [Talaromyces marneffei ATCC 18224]|uniref:Beta-mannosidase B n=1 Tax=Talaromyces marneffei (strain ATCC 18224 / CBS 334.59 / QM 7333) TaxID=441960 RepID=B6QEY7_TALMQ|nr:beta-mannosidase, putative [Talaromyces marneffei ATCC 18224]
MKPFFKQSLSSGWVFKQADDLSPNTWLPVPSIPSVVHQDLLAHKKIADPFISFNELDAEWISEKCWTYRTKIQKPSIPDGAKAFLVFNGLDTFSTVYLDGKPILESDNMFLAHRVDVTEQLLKNDKENCTLEVTFDSALLKAREIQKKYPDHKWISFNDETARLAVRKAQYHWGWDWGRILMTAGVWRDVLLEVYTCRIADIWAEIKLSNNHRIAHVTAYARLEASNTLNECQGTFLLTFQGEEVSRQIVPLKCDGKYKTTFTVDQPKLWWPNGYGEQNLYELTFAITRGGIRTAEVIQRPDKHGKSFFFRINEVDIFCGGLCWIPVDSLLPRVSAEKYRKWIKLMTRGNQVMIRGYKLIGFPIDFICWVWGGGIYEEDAFYDACDELGILVWQDFMFGCGNYPTWPSLLDSIKREAIENVVRLRHHRAIVLYAGNNEDYQVQEQAGLTYDFNDKDPHMWHGRQEKYQMFGTIGGHFNSEFGMEAFPHLETIKYFVEDNKNLYPQSNVIDFQNKADGHGRRLPTYLVENLRTATDLETYIYLTQVVQEETMMFGYRAWRRQWGDVHGLVELKFISIATGLEVRDRIVHENVRLAANGTTNIILDGLIDHTKYSEQHVLAARLWVDGRLVARNVDWPQPFKYLDFVSDSAIDIVPGDDPIVKINNLKAGDSLLRWKYLGQ